MSTFKTFLLLFVLIFFKLNSQTIKGKITDETNNSAVPFAFVGIENNHKGTTADIDGNFQLKVDSSTKQLTVFITGYNKKTIVLSDFDLSKPINIKLKPSEFLLNEVVVTPKENPAHELVRRLIKNKKNLDPRNLPYYSCNTYGKTYFTMSNSKGNEFYYNDDSTRFKKEKSLLTKQYLFFIESASERKYLYKNITQEKILASRVSGFKSAPFATLASQLQSFTFFDDKIEVLDIKYVNPLLKGTFKRYNFEITDTILQNADTTILISFSPKANANFKALKGVIYLNKNHYALSNIIAQPAMNYDNSNGVKIQQQYTFVNNKQWFPSQLVTEILFNQVSAGESGSGKPDRILKCVSKLYISDVNLDSTITIKKKNIEVINDKNYDKKDEAYWLKIRNDSLSQKEKQTYSVVDSVGKAENFEKKLKLFKIISTGQIPMGIISFDLYKLLKVNEYEGLRLGAGLVTNDKLSKWFAIGAYGGYGFKDEAWKYGGHFQLNFKSDKAVNLKVEAAKDLTETANITFLNQNASMLSTQNIRGFLVSVMDKHSFARASFNFPVYRFIKSSLFFSVNERISPSGFGNPDLNFSDVTNKFVSNEAGVQLKIWPGEKFTESFVGLISLGSKAPCFYLNYTHTLPIDVNGYVNSFAFDKIDIRIEQKINFKIRGYINYQIQAGKVFGDVPYSFQFNNNGSRISKYYVSSENTFETMFTNEFISTEYVSLFTSYNTGKLFKINKFMNPEFELTHAIGTGNLLNRTKLTNVLLNDISNYYTEAGIRVKNVLKSGISSLGVGAFYRYGNYALPEFKNNFVVKLVAAISID